MRAIILAAGESKRMRYLTEDKPKCLLNVGGKEILGRQVESLIANGIENIEIVVGYFSDKIIEYCNNNFKNVNFTFHLNENYKNNNNGYSLYLALINSEEPFILLNSDVVYHCDIIKQLLHSNEENVMIVKRKEETLEEDMKVLISEDKSIYYVGKELPENLITLSSNISYEFTGVAKFSKGISLLKNELSKKENEKSWFETSLNILLDDINVHCLLTTLPVMELDFPGDYEEACDLFPYGVPDWEIGIRHESLNKGKRNLIDAFNLLSIMTDTLNKFNIRYWLNWGALLGVYRDNSLIPWDTDIDITIHTEDENTLKKMVLPYMEKIHNCYVVDFNKCYEGDFWIIKDGEKIELNTVHLVDDKYVYSPDRCKLSCPRTHIDFLDTITYNEKLFLIPSKTEQYLEGFYGKSWKTPIKGKKPSSF